MREVSIHAHGADLSLPVGGVEDPRCEVLAVVGEKVVVVGHEVLEVEHGHQVEDAAFADGCLHYESKGNNVIKWVVVKRQITKALKQGGGAYRIPHRSENI